MDTPKKRGRKPTTDSQRDAKNALFGKKSPAKKATVKKPTVKKTVKKPEPVVEAPIIEEPTIATPEPVIPEPVIPEPVIPEPKMEEKKVVEAEPIVTEVESPQESYSPLDEPVIERSYNDTTIMSDIGDIPEPDFSSMKIDFEDVMAEEPAIEVEKEPSAFDNISNPSMQELGDKEKKMASEQLVDTVLDGYEMIHALGAKVCSIDEQKVIKRIVDGEIDKDLSIPISDDTEVTALEYVQNHNEQSKEIFEYDKSFNDKVRPAMVRVFAKRGLGVTDEQYLIGMFVKDIAVKGMMAVSMKKQGKAMLDFMATATAQNASHVAKQQPTTVYEPDTIKSKPKEENVAEIKVATAKVPSTEAIEAEMSED